MEKINFDKTNGLVPAIVQENKTGAVLMLGYMNKQSLQKTISDGVVTFWSRSRKVLWTKGETSENTLKVESIYIDCDEDTLLINAKLIGTHVCHTGNRTCFNKKLLVTKTKI
jgi:phosphoribosyl-AMP cyclohydrolase